MSSTLFVDAIEPNLSSGVHIAGHVIQVQSRKVTNTGYTSTTATMVDITNFYVDITPKYSNSLLHFSANLHASTSVSLGYARFRIVDTNNGSTLWNTNTYCGAMGYNSSVNEMHNLTMTHTKAAGTTNTMRLQVQVKVDGGGNWSLSWSGSDDLNITLMEIAQ